MNLRLESLHTKKSKFMTQKIVCANSDLSLTPHSQENCYPKVSSKQIAPNLFVIKSPLAISQVEIIFYFKSSKIGKRPRWPELEAELSDWLKINKGKKLTLENIGNQAKKIAKELELLNFTGSLTWVNSFLARFNSKNMEEKNDENKALPSIEIESIGSGDHSSSEYESNPRKRRNIDTEYKAKYKAEFSNNQELLKRLKQLEIDLMLEKQKVFMFKRLIDLSRAHANSRKCIRFFFS